MKLRALFVCYFKSRTRVTHFKSYSTRHGDFQNSLLMSPSTADFYYVSYRVCALTTTNKRRKGGKRRGVFSYAREIDGSFPPKQNTAGRYKSNY